MAEVLNTLDSAPSGEAWRLLVPPTSVQDLAEAAHTDYNQRADVASRAGRTAVYSSATEIGPDYWHG